MKRFIVELREGGEDIVYADTMYVIGAGLTFMRPEYGMTMVYPLDQIKWARQDTTPKVTYGRPAAA